MPDIERKSSFEVMRTALIVAFGCALLVSLAAVLLRPYHQQHLESMTPLDSMLDELRHLNEGRKPQAKAMVVDLNNGVYSDAVDPASYDARRAASNPEVSVSIPKELDVARLKQRARYAVVYVIGQDYSAPDALILPVRGRGYQSALYGYLALRGNSREVLALQFYEQDETPGLGTQIQSPAWEAQWPGKQVFDADGRVDIEFDAISGATRTSRGVDRLLKFWLGEFGFGPYLQNLREDKL